MLPLPGLGLADELQHFVGKDRPLPVERAVRDALVPVTEHVLLDHGLEGGFEVTSGHEGHYVPLGIVGS